MCFLPQHVEVEHQSCTDSVRLYDIWKTDTGVISLFFSEWIYPTTVILRPSCLHIFLSGCFHHLRVSTFVPNQNRHHLQPRRRENTRDMKSEAVSSDVKQLSDRRLIRLCVSVLFSPRSFRQRIDVNTVCEITHSAGEQVCVLLQWTCEHYVCTVRKHECRLFRHDCTLTAPS